MMPPFAELPAPESASAVGWLAVTFFTIMAGLYYTLAVFHKLRGGGTEIKPQPFVVQEHASPALKTEQEKLEKKIDAADAWARSSRKGIYEKIEDHSSRIMALESTAARTADNVAKLETKIDGNTQITAETRGAVTQINQSVQNLTSSLTNFLRDRANK